MIFRNVLLFGLITTFFTSCSTDQAKNNNYNDINGKATIIEIKNISDSKCSTAVDVIFTFKPDNADISKAYIYPKIPDNNISIYKLSAPSKTWVEKKGIKVGNIYLANRFEAPKDNETASPVVFTIKDPTIYPSKAEDICN